MDVEVLRHVDDAELARVQKLLDAASAHDDHKALGEHKWLDLVHGGRKGFAGVMIRDPGHDHVIGYGHLSRGDGQWALEIVAHPEHRGVGVEVTLVRTALELAAQEGGGHLHLWVFKPTEIHDGLAHTLGLKKGRDLYQMRAPIPPDETLKLPDGFELRTFEPGRDDEAWLEVNNRAFAHHPEQGAWTLDTLRDRMSEDWFDPDGFLIATDERGMAGFCWTKIHPDEGLGEIYVIGVDPDRQGTGLGRALVVAGLRSLADRGVGTGMLYVDADNDAAVELYRSLGFDVHHVDRAYVTDVEPA